MGLRINTNTAAQNAYRNLSVTDGQMAKSLEKLKVPMDKLLINGIVPVNDCKFCQSRRRMQDQVMEEFQTKFRRRAAEIFVAPQQPHEIRGAKDLGQHFSGWKKVSRKGAKEQRSKAKL